MNTKNITTNFINTGLWASTDKDGIPLDDFKYRNARVPRATQEKAEAFVSDFIEAHKEVAEKAVAIYGEERFAHDLFLNCAGHGAGFWDRNELALPSGKTILYGEAHIPASIGEYLDKACQSNKVEGFDIYRGWVYFA